MYPFILFVSPVDFRGFLMEDEVIRDASSKGKVVGRAQQVFRVRVENGDNGVCAIYYGENEEGFSVYYAFTCKDGEYFGTEIGNEDPVIERVVCHLVSDFEEHFGNEGILSAWNDSPEDVICDYIKMEDVAPDPFLLHQIWERMDGWFETRGFGRRWVWPITAAD